MGPLRKNKNTPLENALIEISVFNFERFKRHLTSLLERVCRLAQSQDTKQNLSQANDPNDTQTEHILNDVIEKDLDENKIVEEESDWINDVKQTSSVFTQFAN